MKGSLVLPITTNDTNVHVILPPSTKEQQQQFQGIIHYVTVISVRLRVKHEVRESMFLQFGSSVAKPDKSSNATQRIAEAEW